MKQVGVLALQGAFIEHEKMLEQLGVSCIELRNKEDLEKPYDGIISLAVKAPFRGNF